MNVPDDLRYTADHEWAKLEDGVIRVGITDYAQDALGEGVQGPDRGRVQVLKSPGSASGSRRARVRAGQRGLERGPQPVAELSSCLLGEGHGRGLLFS